MRILPRFTLLLIAAAGLFFVPVHVPAQDKAAPPVELKVVKYDQLGEIVKSLRGKVVVVDFWATYCVPCKQEFPHLVELARDYAKDGLAAISVSIDEDGKSPEVQSSVLSFLRKQQATFTNLILDEPVEVWQERLGANAVPIVFVFHRDGKYTKFQDKVDYTEIKRLVLELLKK